MFVALLTQTPDSLQYLRYIPEESVAHLSVWKFESSMIMPFKTVLRGPCAHHVANTLNPKPLTKERNLNYDWGIQGIFLTWYILEDPGGI